MTFRVTPKVYVAISSYVPDRANNFARKMCNPEAQKALPQIGSQSGAGPTAAGEADISGQVTVSDSHAFKQKGNDLIKENKLKAAIKAYKSALKAADVEHVDDQEKAVLLSNRSYAYIKCSLFVKVATKISEFALSINSSFHLLWVRCKLFRVCNDTLPAVWAG